MKDLIASHSNRFSRLVVKETAGGIIRFPTYFLISFFLIPIDSVGFYIKAFCLLMVVALSAREILACLKIGFAGAGRKYSVITGQIDTGSELSASLVFNRPPLYGSRSVRIDSLIDVTPKLLSDPDGLVGDLKIKVGKSELRLDGCRLQIIGFDRHRVISCDGLLSPDEPHVSASMSGGSEVHLAGQFVESADGLRPAPGSPLLIIEPRALNGFFGYNLFRVIFLCALLSLLITNWASMA